MAHQFRQSGSVISLRASELILLLDFAFVFFVGFLIDYVNLFDLRQVAHLDWCEFVIHLSDHRTDRSDTSV